MAAPVPAAPLVSWLKAFLAPWWGLVRPRTAARCFADAPRGAFWGGYLLAALACGATWALLGLLNAAGRRQTLAFFPILLDWEQIEKMSLTALRSTWKDWHGEYGLGAFEAITLLGAIFATLGTTLLAWINLPRVHERGPLAHAYVRAFRGIGTTIPILILLMLLVLPLLTMSASLIFWWIQNSGSNQFFFASDPFNRSEWLWSIFITEIGLWLLWTGWAVRGVRSAVPAADSVMRCEGCGYDLRFQPLEGRCPECGLAITATSSGALRPGSTWENQPQFTTWFRTSWQVLRHPARFYRALRLQTSDIPSGGFAGFHYAALTLVAFMVIFLQSVFSMLSSGFYTGGVRALLIEFLLEELFLLPFLFLLVWVFHRLIGAVIATIWMVRSALPNTRWAAKIIDYESAFSWVFLLVNFVYLYFLVFFHTWFFAGVPDWFLGLSPSFLLWLTLNAGLLFWWGWRYRRARLAVQWSNC